MRLTSRSPTRWASTTRQSYARPQEVQGAQTATIKDGLITFKGKVDFSRVYKVVPGSPDPFPPTVADPGAVADAEWSSVVVLPSGIVINAQIVDNKTGTHDRLKSVDIKHRTGHALDTRRHPGRGTVLLSPGHRCLCKSACGAGKGRLRSPPCNAADLRQVRADR